MGLLQALILPALVFANTIANFDVPEYKASVTSTGADYHGPDIQDPAMIFNKTDYYPNIYYGSEIAVVNNDIQENRVVLDIRSYLSSITSLYRLAKTEISAKWMYVDWFVYSTTVEGGIALSVTNTYSGILGNFLTNVRHYEIRNEIREVKAGNQNLEQVVNDYYPILFSVKDYANFVSEMTAEHPDHDSIMFFNIDTQNKDTLDYFYVPRITFFEEANGWDHFVWYHEANIWLYFVEGFVALIIGVGIAYGVVSSKRGKRKPKPRKKKRNKASKKRLNR